MAPKIFIANDHAAVSLKQLFIKDFPEIEWVDLGTSTEDSVDYPDFAKQLCVKMEEGPESLGLLICGSGQGMAITANKFAHIRAALCWNTEVAQLAREHNKANVLCLGSRLLSPESAKEIFKAFIETDFAGGRHQRRVDKINNVRPE